MDSTVITPWRLRLPVVCGLEVLSSGETKMVRATFKVSGMTCGNCVKHVTKALGKVPGVAEPSVDLASGRVELNYDPTQSTPEAIAEALGKAGYPATAQT
jgi:copper chaperone CopZ